MGFHAWIYRDSGLLELSPSHLCGKNFAHWAISLPLQYGFPLETKYVINILSKFPGTQLKIKDKATLESVLSSELEVGEAWGL